MAPRRFFNRLAEIVSEYLKKGSKIYVEGKLQTRKWQDQQGQDRYTTEVVAGEMQMLDARGDNQGQAQHSGASADQYRAASGGTSAPAPGNQGDDIPF